MKIGFFYPSYYPVSASASVHGFQLARGLIKRGHKLLTCTGDANPDCRRYPVSKFGQFRMMLDSDILYIRLMSYFQTAFVWKFVKPLRLPVIWEINAPLEEQLVAAGGEESKQLSAEIRSQNRRLRLYSFFIDGAVCVSEAMRKYAEGYLGIKNSYCVPNGSDPKLFNPNNAVQPRPNAWKNKFIVLWAGNAALPQQATGLICEVARKIAEKDKDILFVMINSESGFSLPQEDNIAVLTGVNYLSMPGYINNADLCLCLYKEYDFSPYGCYISPLKLFDFMSCAKPVIASDMGQMADVIKNNVNGFLTDNSVEDICNKIMHCRDQRNIAEKIGANARKTVLEYYNWDRVAQQTEEILLAKIGKR